MRVFVVDNKCGPGEHGQVMRDFIRMYNPSILPILVNFQSEEYTEDLLIDLAESLGELVDVHDIVLITWSMAKNIAVDAAFAKLASYCTVVCAAGNNYGKMASDYSPIGAPGVHIIGCINKRSEIASMSNVGNNVTYMFGTNMILPNSDGTVHGGTSVAASIFTGLLSRSYRTREPSIFMRRAKRALQQRFLNELSNSV